MDVPAYVLPHPATWKGPTRAQQALRGTMLMGGRLGDQTPSPASLPLLGYRGESRNGRGLSRNGGNDPLGADSSKSIGATLLEPRAAIRMGQCARPPSPAGRPRVSALRDGEQEDVQGETLRRETLLAVEWFRSVLLELARCWRTDDMRNSPKRANLFAFDTHSKCASKKREGNHTAALSPGRPARFSRSAESSHRNSRTKEYTPYTTKHLI